MNNFNSQFAYDTHELMKDKSVNLTFAGDFSHDLVSVLLVLAKNTVGSRRVMKKIYKIMINYINYNKINLVLHKF